MHHRTLVVSLLLSLFAGVARLSSQQPGGYDTTVVVGGGDWRQGKSHGTYRVTVRTTGFDHVASSIRLEWLQLGAGDSAIVVATDSTLPIADRMYSLSPPELVANYEGWNISVCGTHTYAGSKACWLIWIGPPGKASLVRGPT